MKENVRLEEFGNELLSKLDNLEIMLDKSVGVIRRTELELRKQISSVKEHVKSSNDLDEWTRIIDLLDNIEKTVNDIDGICMNKQSDELFLEDLVPCDVWYSYRMCVG